MFKMLSPRLCHLAVYFDLQGLALNQRDPSPSLKNLNSLYSVFGEHSESLLKLSNLRSYIG